MSSSGERERERESCLKCCACDTFPLQPLTQPPDALTAQVPLEPHEVMGTWINGSGVFITVVRVVFRPELAAAYRIRGRPSWANSEKLSVHIL